MWLNQLVQLTPALLGLVVLAEEPGEREEDVFGHWLLVLRCI